MTISLLSLFWKALILTYKEGISLLIGGFYLLIVAIYPFTSNLITKVDTNNSINIIWISLLFSILLTLENIFHKDYEDGSLDLFFLIKTPLDFIILIKSFIHWVTIGLPLVFITPFLFLILNIEFNLYFLISLSLATFNIINLSVICASLTLSIKQKGILLSLITLPLSIPTLIFSFSSISFLLLFLNFILVLSITPLVSSFIIRLSFE